MCYLHQQTPAITHPVYIISSEEDWDMYGCKLL